MCFGGLGVVVTGYFSKSRSSCNESIFDSGMHKAITMFEVSLKAHKQLENNFPERTQQLHTATALWFPLDYRLKWLSRVLAHKFSFSVVVTFCFSTCITLKKSSNSFCCSGGGPLMSDTNYFQSLWKVIVFGLVLFGLQILLHKNSFLCSHHHL